MYVGIYIHIGNSFFDNLIITTYISSGIKALKNYKFGDTSWLSKHIYNSAICLFGQFTDFIYTIMMANGYAIM